LLIGNTTISQLDAGFRGRKGSLYEAGIHEPTIVA